MEIYNWITLGISTGVSIVGFLVTIIVVIAQFRNAEKSQNRKEKRKVYFKVYETLGELEHDRMIIYNPNYVDKLRRYQARIRIVGSESVINAYDSFIEIVTRKQSDFEVYCNSHDPRMDDRYYNGFIDDDGNTSYSSFLGTESDITIFERDSLCYREDNCLDKRELIEQLDRILNHMRKDIQNGKYSRHSRKAFRVE